MQRHRAAVEGDWRVTWVAIRKKQSGQTAPAPGARMGTRLSPCFGWPPPARIPEAHSLTLRGANRAQRGLLTHPGSHSRGSSLRWEKAVPSLDLASLQWLPPSKVSSCARGSSLSARASPLLWPSWISW